MWPCTFLTKYQKDDNGCSPTQGTWHETWGSNGTFIFKNHFNVQYLHVDENICVKLGIIWKITQQHFCLICFSSCIYHAWHRHYIVVDQERFTLLLHPELTTVLVESMLFYIKLIFVCIIPHQSCNSVTKWNDN